MKQNNKHETVNKTKSNKQKNQIECKQNIKKCTKIKSWIVWISFQIEMKKGWKKVVKKDRVIKMTERSLRQAENELEYDMQVRDYEKKQAPGVLYDVGALSP